VGARPELAARPGDAALGVDDDRTVEGDPAAPDQGPQRQHRRRRVAAGDGHQIRGRQRRPVGLDEPVDPLAEALRRPVLAVPGLVDRTIAEAEVGAQIEDGDAPIPERRHRRRARPMGQGAEGRVDAVGQGRGVEGLDGPRPERGAGQARKRLRRRLADAGVPHQRVDVDAGVLTQ
jgi:hypothetical protein